MAKSTHDKGTKPRPGAIVVRDGLANTDRAFLSGGFLQMANILESSTEQQWLTRIGTEALAVQPSSPSNREIG
ncbi:conjugal transfer protein TraD [Rhizobium sp. RCAM05973]|uniref:conjugal transfer protein TraD n=1 Tax=Rhizobium sp. RCAM05973 TaxID=2994066 RepID=UPI0022EBF70E|nr:conjugal transfer protein TraD [Rhizobium sp. RCAM05973]